jgi:DNA-binding NarL/FixJ family response regulator
MDILVHLKSRILTEALVHWLDAQTAHRVYGFFSWGIGGENRPPDMVLCDGSNCRNDGRCRWPESRVIMVDTGRREEEALSYLISRQIDGVWTPDMQPEMAGKALAAVERGDFGLPHSDFRKVLRQARVAKDGRFAELSEKQRRIIALIVQGCKNREIAEDLHLSEQTVKSHVSRILSLLDLSNRTQLASLFADKQP